MQKLNSVLSDRSSDSTAARYNQPQSRMVDHIFDMIFLDPVTDETGYSSRHSVYANTHANDAIRGIIEALE